MVKFDGVRRAYRNNTPLSVRLAVRDMRSFPGRVRTACLYPVRFRRAYTRSYFLERDCAEANSYKLGIIRPGDMGAAIGYALGYRNLEDVCDVLGADANESQALPTHASGIQQVQMLLAGAARKPKLVVDVGAGRGEMSALLNHHGIRCMAIEPASIGPDLMRETCLKYGCSKYPEERFLNTGLLDGLHQLQKNGITPDTVIMCESLEHIPRREFDRAFEIIRGMLGGGGIFVITNWPEFHPIRPVRFHWDHVRTVDDSVYDGLASQAVRTVFRRGSHLVLEF